MLWFLPSTTVLLADCEPGGRRRLLTENIYLWHDFLAFFSMVGIIKWVNSPAGFILCCFYRFLSSLTRLLFKEPASQQFRAAVTNNSNNSEVIICIVWWLKEASTVAAQRSAQYTYLDNFFLFSSAALPNRSCFHCVALAFCCRSSRFALYFSIKGEILGEPRKKLILRFALASLLIINIHASATTHLSKPPASTRSYFFIKDHRMREKPQHTYMKQSSSMCTDCYAGSRLNIFCINQCEELSTAKITLSYESNIINVFSKFWWIDRVRCFNNG